MRLVQVHRMKNGMMLYYGYSGGTNLAGIGIRAGSMYDPRDKEGVAHFVEHMLCRKSRRYSDKEATHLLQRYLGGTHGGDIDICTDRSYTYYGHLDLLRKQYMLKAFDLMASFVHPETRMIDTEDAPVELAAVHNEYCLNGVDSTEMLLADLTYETLYTKNPARSRVDFRPEQWASLSESDAAAAARQFVRRWYVPANMFVIMLGPDFKQAKKLMDNHFGNWENGAVPRLDYDRSDELPKLSEIRSLEVTRPGIRQHHVAIAFPTESYMSEDAEAIDILARILDWRVEERLREDNRDRGKGIYHPSVESVRTFCHGILYISFATAGDKDYARFAEAAVIDEIKKLKSELVSRDEFDLRDRVRDEYNDTFWNMPNGLVDLIRDAAANGDPELVSLNDFRRRLNRVNRRKLCDIANKYFGENYARVVISPA
jgi:predicted Zn-dependent peptidase